MSATERGGHETYSTDELIAALQDVADDGVMPYRDEFDEALEDGPSASTVYDRFNGWEEAAEAAGLEPKVRVNRGLDEEELLELIRKAAEGDRGPTMDEFNERIDDGPTAQAIARRFDGWTAAVEEAGLTPAISSRGEYSKEELKERLREAAHDGIGPTKAEFTAFHDSRPAGTTVQERFGGWNKGVRAAGLIPQYNPTREEMLEQLRIVADGDEAPKGGDFAAHPHTISKSTVYDRFDNYASFVEEAGLKQPKQGTTPTPSKEEIIADLQLLAEDGVAPKAETLDNHPETVNKGAVQSQFESYNAAVELADLRPQRASNVTDGQIIEEIQMLADDGQAPTAQEFQDHPETVSFGAAVDHFGSWNEAVTAAGFDPNTRGSPSPTKDEVISHLRRLGEDHKAPTQEEVTNDSEAPAVSTIKSLFGGWKEALDAAELEMRQQGATRITEVELVDHVKRVGDDEPPTQQEITDDPEAPHASTIVNRIGWDEAKGRAGYTDSNRITVGEMVYHLQRVADDKVAPTQKALNEDPDAPHASTIKRRIGWDEAIERAGLIPR
jgi:hypothetical protein